MKNQTLGSYGASERITFDLNDYYAIQNIHGQSELFRYLVHSLSPKIYGHAIVKAGLLLALFGGSTTANADNVRAQSHVLLVGDPGLGKSQLLQACTNVAPRGVYVCASASSKAGLTVTMTKEAGGETALEAGALMLADQGCCCIDEFDKLSGQLSCLLEAMEQQTISVAKAGTVCTLPARCSIFAAANPAGGHYNKERTVTENLKMPSPILSRFDLIFILVDNPDENKDRFLSEHILSMKSSSSSSSSSFNNGQHNLDVTVADDSTGLPLEERLGYGDCKPPNGLPHAMFRKYIAYAQKYVHPELSDDAKHVLKQFYLRLRRQFQCGDCTPVTLRQLHSLMRLTQARAKVELREIASQQDAEDVVAIVRQSLIEVFSDEAGRLDTTRSQNGTGMSKKKQVMSLLRLLKEKSEMDAKSVFTVNEIKEICLAANICRTDLRATLDSLNLQCLLINKGQNRYQLVCADT